MKNVFFVMSANCRSSTSRLDPKMIHSIVANAIIKLLPLDAINALKYSNQVIFANLFTLFVITYLISILELGFLK